MRNAINKQIEELDKKVQNLTEKLDAEIWKRENPAKFKYGDKVKVLDSTSESNSTVALFSGKVVKVTFKETRFINIYPYWEYLIDTGTELKTVSYGIIKDEE